MPVRLLTRIGDTRDALQWDYYNIEKYVAPPVLLGHNDLIEVLQTLSPDTTDFYKQITNFRMSENAPSADMISSGSVKEIQEANDNTYPIYAWIDNSTSGNAYDILYYTDSNEIIVGSARNLFMNFNNVENIDVQKFNFNSCKDFFQMFYKCEKLKSINYDYALLNASPTNLSYMFYSCYELMTDIHFENMNTSQCTDTSHMFYHCEKIKNINISNWDTSKITDFSSMFSYCESLETFECDPFDFSSAEDISYMLQDINPKLYSEFGEKNISFKIFKNYIEPGKYVEVNNCSNLFTSTIDSQYFYTTTTDHINYINPILYGNFKARKIYNMYLFGTPLLKKCIGPIIIGEFICTQDDPSAPYSSVMLDFCDENLDCPSSYKNICIAIPSWNGVNPQSINFANQYTFSHAKVSNSIIIGCISTLDQIHQNAESGMDPYLNKIEFINHLMSDTQNNVNSSSPLTIFNANKSVYGIFNNASVGKIVYLPSLSDLRYAMDNISNQSSSELTYAVTANTIDLTSNSESITNAFGDHKIKVVLNIYENGSTYSGSPNMMDIGSITFYNKDMYSFYDYTQNSDASPCISITPINGPYFAINTDFASDPDTVKSPSKLLTIYNDDNTLFTDFCCNFIESLTLLVLWTNSETTTFVYETDRIMKSQYYLYDIDNWTNPTVIPTSDPTYGCRMITFGVVRESYYS